MEESSVPPIDPDFEPQSRPRSCTWPLPRPEISAVKPEGPEGPMAPSPPPGRRPPTRTSRRQAARVRAREGSSRRNAWGNQSYADLISQAIENSPEKRLTLAQIYEWMVKTVPYFRDKGDTNSSAGWKNSIRHNLSLHNKFLRVHNESTGKSSWWMLNPEGGKTGKAPRRRAASMDNSSKLLKSRMRAKQTKKQAGGRRPGRGRGRGAAAGRRGPGAGRRRQPQLLPAVPQVGGEQQQPLVPRQPGGGGHVDQLPPAHQLQRQHGERAPVPHRPRPGGRGQPGRGVAAGQVRRRQPGPHPDRDADGGAGPDRRPHLDGGAAGRGQPQHGAAGPAHSPALRLHPAAPGLRLHRLRREQGPPAPVWPQGPAGVQQLHLQPPAGRRRPPGGPLQQPRAVQPGGAAHLRLAAPQRRPDDPGGPPDAGARRGGPDGPGLQTQPAAGGERPGAQQGGPHGAAGSDAPSSSPCCGSCGPRGPCGSAPAAASLPDGIGNDPLRFVPGPLAALRPQSPARRPAGRGLPPRGAPGLRQSQPAPAGQRPVRGPVLLPGPCRAAAHGPGHRHVHREPGLRRGLHHQQRPHGRRRYRLQL
ncbi:unnamed protein product [Tetraodon nigroviridis]|uniref:(spotted green pufferfish) hypothetical protein n=1 Tax=Tetraodon nigroviridis TaxID=99883 RepID=Q4RP97_TETNG|nr:unnamed protein product [Tetraodon nigroviridis]